MRRTVVRDHALRSEGKAYGPGGDEEERWIRVRGHIGPGLCECGATSAMEWTDVARKRWHAEHKATIHDREDD
jgi:hypothetical protein